MKDDGLSLLEKCAIGAAVVILRVLYATWRVRIIGDAGMRSLRAERKPFILALWHADLLPLLVQHRGEGVAVLISEHRDGEMVTRVALRFGLRAIRGSTTRGAARALLALIHELEEGHEVAVTPDGPRGPAHQFAPGAVVAAHRAKVPIVAIGVHAASAWRMRSWDRMVVPKPFTQLTIAYGEPRFVQADGARAAAQCAGEFENFMGEAYERAAEVRA